MFLFSWFLFGFCKTQIISETVMEVGYLKFFRVIYTKTIKDGTDKNL